MSKFTKDHLSEFVSFFFDNFFAARMDYHVPFLHIIFCCIPLDFVGYENAFPVMPTLPLLAGDLCFFASSPALPLWYINLPLFTSTINIEQLVRNKTDFLLVLLFHTPSREDRTRIVPLFFLLNLMKC